MLSWLNEGPLALDPRLTRLLEAVVAVGSDLELEAVLRRVVEAACALVGARYGALGVISETGGLSAFVHHGVDDATAARIGHLPEGHGILGLLIEEPRPLRLDDLADHPASYGFPAHHPPMRAFLGAPVRVRDQVFGNIYLAEKLDGGRFTAEDEELLVGLSVVAGSAIENARLYEDLQGRERWRDAVLEVSAMGLSGATVTDIRARIAELGASLTDAGAACIVAGHEEGLWVVASTADTVPLGYLAAEGAPVWATLREGLVCRVEDGPLFPGRHVLWVPLREGSHLVAALGVIRDRPFGDREEQLLTGFADQVALALTHGQAQAELQRLNLIEERERIGRDLHDTIIQRLFATGLSLQATIRRADGQPDLTARLEQTVDTIDEIVKEIRTTIFALQGGGGREHGLRTAVLELVEEFSEVLHRPPRVRFDGPIDTIVSDEVVTHLLPVVREALTNVAKHAGADVVELELTADQGGIRLRVGDDGRGIDPDAAPGFGLRNLGERAAALGGEFSVTSRADGRGTVVSWRVPGR